jgi:WD40 repeat protein
MDAWVSERDGGWLLITGSPGLGKSALMDRWLRRREAAGSPTAFHFIRRGHLDWAEPQIVQRNLAAQIEVMFPEQRDAEADPTYRLEQLLGRVSKVLAQRSERLVLLVDGLDEAMTLGTASKDNPVPKIFPLELPERVFVVTASRPRHPHLSWLEHRTGPFEKVALDERLESNDRAVREYWTELGLTMTPPLTEELVQAALRGAEGNLLHAVKLRELWNKPGVVRTAKAVPRGFPGMVDELWQRTVELPEAQRKLVRDGLAFVCAARESLPLRVIEELLHWKEDQAGDEFLPLAREMLLEEPWGAVPAYRPFHESLRELVERKLAERKGGSIGAYHRVLADYASWPVEGDTFQRGYALRHRIEHRVEAGALDDAAKACMEIGYLTAKACAEGVHAIERDIRFAAEAREHGEVRGRLTMLGRLVAASSHWATEVPEALPALLHDRALTNAPELLEEVVGLAHTFPAHPRLRHPLQVRGMSRILHGHHGHVNALAVLPDGRVVSGSNDKTVRVWNLETGRVLATFHGHEGYVNALAVLPNGRVVSGSHDNTVRVWDLETSRALATFHGHQGYVSALAVLPNGRVVSGSHDNTVRVWDLETGRSLATLHGHRNSVNAVAVLPDGRVLSGSNDKTVRVWDLETNRTVATLQGHTAWVRALAVFPDGRVVSGSVDGTVRVWDVETGHAFATFDGHQGSMNALAVLARGCIVSGSSDNTMKVWDVQMGRAVATLRGHQGWVNALMVLPDGRVVSGSSDNTVRVWDVEAGRAVATLRGHQGSVRALAVLPDGRVVSGSVDSTVRVWDVKMGRAVATFHGHKGIVRTLAVLLDGRIISGSENDTPRVWDVKTGRAVATLYGHQGLVRALAVLPDGRVVSGSSDKTLRVWDVQRGLVVATIIGHQGGVNALAVLPDGRVVSGSSDETLRVWDVETARALAIVYGDASFRAVACIDQHLIVAGDALGNVWFIDLPELPRAS